MIKVLVDEQENEILAISNDVDYLLSKIQQVLSDAEAGYDPNDLLDGGWEDFDFYIHEYKITEKDDVLLKGS